MGILLDLVLTAFFYLLVPAVFCWLGKSFTKKQINKIVIINGAIIWFIFRIVSIELNGEPGTGAAVFLWSAVAHWLLKKCCLMEDKDEKVPQEEPNVAEEIITVENSEINKTEDNVQMSLSPKGEAPKTYGNYAIPASDVRLIKEDNELPQPKPKIEQEVKTEEPSQKSTRYCSRCGGKIDSDTTKCTQCGKQYLNKLTKIGIALIFGAVLLIIIVIICATIGTTNDNTTSTTNTTTSGNTNMSYSEYIIAKRITEIMDGKDSEYFDYIQEAYKIAKTGNESYGKGKGAVVNYINHLPIEYGESIIMYRLIYQSDNTYCREIVEYLNGRDDISYDDTVYILTNLGFMVSSNGTVSWD